ncbi:acyl-CoA dehydrogenase [Pseudomonas protegens]|uniref:acyl-CoA dehydrogenase n=1 Tax=Pseudomonas TaxID=286 RepID=UPI0008070F88|nr:acyl-CoA dehydrogenase [Pseudomonas protegens]OBZ23600.1 acyl-CoA dehydrogenase [Pseudomonas protegens]OBZ30030.1 acyl-CoA dehydrogenase [Pseudomonas protegens]OKK44828.1 acyl-CoA dehydrogenase [Pseudomonas protegens]OKK50794.1 acyl-CoA dehydrogenase [Pseudomonas protegens]OKK56857.1 acyl-CoA dehydrogenase [Pseudomonas protegens]
MNALTRPDTPQAALEHNAQVLQRARVLLQQTLDFIREQARPWSGSGLARASDDPYVISRFGDLQIRIEVAAALQERAQHRLQEDQDPAEIAIALAEAAIAAAEALVAAGNAEFELTGQRTPQPQTLDDPLRWKYQLIGNYRLNGVPPQGFRSVV